MSVTISNLVFKQGGVSNHSITWGVAVNAADIVMFIENPLNSGL